MKIDMVGAAGALSTALVRNRSHEIVEISRSTGVDLYTGAGRFELQDLICGRQQRITAVARARLSSGPPWSPRRARLR